MCNSVLYAGQFKNLEVRLPLRAYSIWERKIGRFDAHPWKKFQNPDLNANNGRLLTKILTAYRRMTCITKPQQIRGRTGNLGKEISIRGPVQNRAASLPSSRFLKEEFSRHVLIQSRYWRKVSLVLGRNLNAKFRPSSRASFALEQFCWVNTKIGYKVDGCLYLADFCLFEAQISELLRRVRCLMVR